MSKKKMTPGWSFQVIMTVSFVVTRATLPFNEWVIHVKLVLGSGVLT